MLNYLLPIASAVLGAFALVKDWDSYKKSGLRLAVLFMIIATGIGGAFNNFYRDKHAEDRHDRDQKQISALKTEIAGLKSAFADSLGKVGDGIHNLSQQVSDLRTQRNTVEYEKKANQLEADLKAKANSANQLKAVIEGKAGLTTDATVTHGGDAIAKQQGQMVQKDIPEAPKETDVQKSVQRLLDNW